MERCVGLLVLGWIAVGWVGCAEPYEEMSPDRVCLDTAYAVSNRVYTCLGDADRAKQVFDDFQSQTTCIVQDIGTEPIAGYYDCPTQVLNAGCGEITTIAATGGVEGYLGLSPKCPLILTARGGGGQ